jgi:predicted Zn finger-like uncharacterized protein
MVSGPLTDGCYGGRARNAYQAMLIVCPNCSTSYMVDPSALGSGGRTVRCARCKSTWFASWQKQPPSAKAFVDGAIAEAEAQASPASAEPPSMPPAANIPEAPDDFGAEPAEPAGAAESHTEDAWPAPEPAAHDEALEPVTVEDAPSLVPPEEHAALGEPDPPEPDSEDVESYAARRQRMQARRKMARRSSRWTAIVLVLFAFNVALVGARNEVVRYLPQTASLFAAIGLPVNLRHLSFENVRVTKEQQDGVNVLVVEGTIVSTADKPVTVPRLRFAARDAAGQEIYTWTALPSRSILGPGEKLDFRSRLASPPADAKNVMVRFFNAHDTAVTAGAK